MLKNGRGNGNSTGHGIFSVMVSNSDQDAASAITSPHTMMEPSILQGTIQGSATMGNKCPNTDSVGSQLTQKWLDVLTSSKRSTMRNISRITSRQIPEVANHGTCELDSHADTCVAGSNCIVFG